MSFDPIQEDCLRLILQDMRRKRVFPLENPAFIEHDMDVYSQDPARLIKTDEDRSFHLTTRAAEMVDYRIPFVTDEAEIDRMSDEAEGMLREAAELDPSNWDARRMLSALVAQSNDEYVSYLLDAREEVEHDCALMVASAQDPYSREFAAGIGRNPQPAMAGGHLIPGAYLRTIPPRLAHGGREPLLRPGRPRRCPAHRHVRPGKTRGNPQRARRLPSPPRGKLRAALSTQPSPPPR